MKGWDWVPWSEFFECWVLNQHFHSPLLLSSRGFWVPLHFLPLRVVSSAYLRLLIFLPAFLIPACASSSPVFLRRRSGGLIFPSLRVFQFSVIHRVKGFGVVNNAKVDVFLELSCFFDDVADNLPMLGIWSLVPLPLLKSSLNIWKFWVHMLLKPDLETFEHYFVSVWNECNCVVVRTFFVIAFLWDWNENWSFPVLWPLLCFPNLLAYWVQLFHSIIFQDLK